MRRDDHARDEAFCIDGAAAVMIDCAVLFAALEGVEWRDLEIRLDLAKVQSQ